VQPAGELGARAHTELRIDPSQVARHGSFAEKERGGNLAVRPTLGNKVCDARSAAVSPSMCVRRRNASKLGARLLDSGDRPELLEAVERRPDRVRGRALLACRLRSTPSASSARARPNESPTSWCCVTALLRREEA
jgi:hypothetical protein